MRGAKRSCVWGRGEGGTGGRSALSQCGKISNCWWGVYGKLENISRVDVDIFPVNIVSSRL